MGWVECVPNFSEGRDESVIDAMAVAVRAVPHAHLLDIHRDASHHRSVFTIVGEQQAVLEAVFQAAKVAVAKIDLTQHTGAHPRIGATDVVPFVPLGTTTMKDCVALASELGGRLADRLGVPVFLYGHAATMEGRRVPHAFRRGGFERLVSTIGATPATTPDYGGLAVHATAGATAVGARTLLVAFNMFLDTHDEGVARDIAGRIRTSADGLPDLQAKGFLVDGTAQVSMNLLDPVTTTPRVVFEAVQRAAQRLGIAVSHSEFVGLVPEAAVDGVDEEVLKLRGSLAEHLLEPKVLAVGGRV